VETPHDFRAARLRRQGLVVTVPSRTVVVERAVQELTGTSPPRELVARLERRELDDELRARLRRFLETGDDAELEAALGELPGNPVQAAFNLLASGP
jgi:hypothetical protein